MAALGRIGLEHVERAQQFSSGKNLSLYWNLRAEGTTVQAQGTKAIDPSHEICELHIARAH